MATISKICMNIHLINVGLQEEFFKHAVYD